MLNIQKTVLCDAVNVTVVLFFCDEMCSLEQQDSVNFGILPDYCFSRQWKHRIYLKYSITVTVSV